MQNKTKKKKNTKPDLKLIIPIAIVHLGFPLVHFFQSIPSCFLYFLLLPSHLAGLYHTEYHFLLLK